MGEREVQEEGIYVYLWLFHVVVKKPTKHCKTSILQLKISLKKEGRKFCPDHRLWNKEKNMERNQKLTLFLELKERSP